MRAVLCIALVACSQPARAPRAEQIVTLDDTTFHVRADGNVDATVTRAFGETRGSGNVTLVQADLAASRSSSHLRLAGARAWLGIAKALVDTPQLAYQVALHGIDELGAEYAKRGVQDDTGIFILLARTKIDTDPAHAASLVVGVLTDRIRLYVKRYHPHVQ
ncbi:MAG TPA: hypothetical protein VN253_23945 [Kofleriaceae bacterium]|nr:hypothetical protein [Kofleriaceae bacterium]